MTLLREIAGMGLAGPLALGMLGCSLLVGLTIVALAIVSPLETGGPRLRALVLAEVTCMASTLALLFALVTAGRRTVVAVSTVPAMDPSAAATALANVFSQSGIGLFFVGITLGALGALLALAEAIWLLRAPRGPRGAAPLRRILHLVVSVLLGTVGLGVLRQINEVISRHRHAGSEERRASMDASSAHLATARVHVVLIAVAGTVVLLIAFLAASRRGGAAEFAPGGGSARLDCRACPMMDCSPASKSSRTHARPWRRSMQKTTRSTPEPESRAGPSPIAPWP